MMEEAVRSLKNGISIMMFPEGTRSKDGSIQDFKKGAFQMALGTKKPILPVIIDGTGKVLPKKGIIFSGGYQLRVRVLDPVYPQDFGTTDPEELASRLKCIMEVALNEIRTGSDIQ